VTSPTETESTRGGGGWSPQHREGQTKATVNAVPREDGLGRRERAVEDSIGGERSHTSESGDKNITGGGFFVAGAGVSWGRERKRSRQGGNKKKGGGV